MNYTELKANVAAWLNRDDLTGNIPTFIELAEAAMSHKLRVMQQLTRTTLTLDAEYVDLPSDWVETVSIHTDASSGSRRLDLVPLHYMDERPTSDSDDACWYAHTGNGGAEQIRVWPVQTDAEATLTYYAALPTLSDAEPTNWALTAIPGAYLYGALLQTAPFLVEEARLNTWGALYEAAVSELVQADRKRRQATGMRRR